LLHRDRGPDRVSLADGRQSACVPVGTDREPGVADGDREVRRGGGEGRSLRALRSEGESVGAAVGHRSLVAAEKTCRGFARINTYQTTQKKIIRDNLRKSVARFRRWVTAELRSAGRTGASAPTWFVIDFRGRGRPRHTGH